MKTMDIPISKRARKYGYVFWTAKQNQKEVENLLGGLETVNVIFQGEELGEKRIDWKNRRISIGAAKMRTVLDKGNYKLKLLAPKMLKIQCE